MAIPKKNLSDNSLGILEKMVLSKNARLKKKTREIPNNPIIYYIILREYERASNKLLDALYLCETSYQGEIT